MRPTVPPLLLLTTLVTAAPLAAQTPTFSRTDVTAIGAPRSIVSADFNRDGWPDLALGGTTRDSIGILLNRGAHALEEGTPFDAVREIVVGGGPFELAAGDLNRDGSIDLAIANADADAITILMGRGDGTFDGPRNLPAPGNPRGVTIADLNRDGLPDIAFTAYTAGVWRVAYGDGAGNFAGALSYPTGANPQGLVSGDFNHDGSTDVAVAEVSGKLSVYMLAGYPNYVRRTITGPNTTWNVIVSGDFNRDGWTDLAAASTANQVVGLFRGSSGGTFTYYAAALTQSSPRGIEAADVNQDGWLDLVTGDRGTSSIAVNLGRGDGSGQFDPRIFAAGGGARDVALADFDHDGRIDVATANEFGNSTSLLQNVTALVAPGFAFEPLELPSGIYNSVYGVADFNENGKLDILRDRSVILDSTTESRTLRADYSYVAGGIGDFNGDGHVDVIFTRDSYQSPGLQVAFGNGAGGFSDGPILNVGRSGWLRVADMNRDGRADFVALLAGGATICLGRGDGTFTESARAPVNGANWVEVADLDRDGALDAVIATTDGIVSLLGNAAGQWKTGLTFEPDVPRYGFGLGDVNEDGKIDLVVSDGEHNPYGSTSWTSRVTVALGNGDGTFVAAQQYDTRDPDGWGVSNSVVLGDLNNDGHLDFFTSNGELMEGRGDGTFGDLQRFQVRGWHGTLIADLNGDGLDDVLGYTRFSDTFGGSSHIAMLNTRRTPSQNRPPAGLGLSPNITWNYATYWYFEDETGIWPTEAVDPDLHLVKYRWRLADGTVVSNWPVYAPTLRPGEYDVTLTADDYRGGSQAVSTHLTVTPFKEMVLTAEDGYEHGAWQKVADTTAVYERLLWHPDAGAPKLVNAVPDPVHHVDFGFLADPTQTYKLWIRLRAQNDSWSNDSVFVQFTGAKDSSGNPIYEIGTSSALAVNLEECSGCGVVGWGWEDDGWGAVNRNGVTLRFPAGGPQTLRIQTREDGVSIDQIVLSSEKYLTTRPGKAKNDNTLLGHIGPWIYPPIYR